MSRTASQLRFSRYAWGVVAYNIGVVLWGAYVRATGSGAGCGSHWPLCNGEVVPRAPSLETMIEYSHRVTSGIALLLVLALPFMARKLFPKGHGVRIAAWWTLALMIVEAAIGAGLVLFELVADNASAARAMFMGTHLFNTFLLLGAMTLTAWWAGGGTPLTAEALRGRGRLAWLVFASLGGTLLVGISGAVAALGDTLFPATSLGQALRDDLSASSHILVQLRILHPFIAVGVSFLILTLIAAIRGSKPPRDARRFANLLNMLVFAQLAVGGVNVLLLAPVWMQIIHLLLADMLWLCLVLTSTSVLAVPRHQEASDRVSEPPLAEPVTG